MWDSMGKIENDPNLFVVPSLFDDFNQPKRLSPLLGSFGEINFVHDPHQRILLDIESSRLGGLGSSEPEPLGPTYLATMELAGPRRFMFWDSKSLQVAIVTCGGIAPGLNKVVQSLVTVLTDRYKVKSIFGVPFGYFGFTHEPFTRRLRFGWQRLDKATVQNIDTEAGSVLGSGRGNSNPQAVVDALVHRNINILFTIGGDGTLAGAHAIAQEVASRHLPISVVGIPKTIDNDVPWVSKSFGFETAVEKAVEALQCALTEARGVYHGIGLVKLMGRNSGALTATAACAVNDLDFVLVPEVNFTLDGDNGLLSHLTRRVQEKGYVTLAVAEGAGQNLFPSGAKEYDASGNIKLNDIGTFLQKTIVSHFRDLGIEATLKYIDPSYMLRAQTTTADDSVFCANLAQNAAHAAMAGKTNLMIGYAHERFTHVPLKAVVGRKKQLDTNSPLWLSVLASTGQPHSWG